jgi:hypothetical protein
VEDGVAPLGAGTNGCLIGEIPGHHVASQLLQLGGLVRAPNERHDLVPPGPQGPGQSPTQKAGRAGDEGSHEGIKPQSWPEGRAHDPE